MCGAKERNMRALYHYNVEVHPDVAGQIDEESFSREAEHILNLERGLAALGVPFLSCISR